MSQQQSNENNAAKLIGLPLDRVDARLKVTGGTPYSAEYQIPNLAYGMLVESTITAGKIRAIDTTAAERAPGVIAVITHLNAERLARPVHQPSGESLPVLQEPNIFYAGQHVACVVAETLEQAEYATALVRVTYDVAPYAVDMKDRLNQAMMPELRFGSSGPRVQSKRGDFARGLNSAAVRVEETYSTPVEHHNPMEPHATIAMWEGDNLIVYDANQGVSGARQALAFNFGISQDNVRVISKYLGGGFGCKGQSWGHTTIAALAARHVKRPVKVVLRRQQMFSSNGHRSPTMQELRLGADADGRLTAMSHTSTVHTSMMDEFIEPSGMITEMMYSCPNVDVAHRLVRVNVPTPTFTRAPGESSGSFALESAMDELAYKLKLDPIELRERNYAEKDEGSGHPFSSKSLREAYKLGAERFGWKQRNPQPRSMREGRWLIGYGFASASYPANFRPAAAKATMFADGTVLAQSGTQDVGGGMYTIATQIVADTLGLPMNRVRFELGDTRFPEAPVAGGSCSAASTGSAVLLAAKSFADARAGNGFAR
ncbi:MAG: xanthine dehydrogenase family protein molybdopterin-binding subunit [Blastocatellia bacterium]